MKTEKDTYLVFDQTPFYAEMGGQVGDTGHALIDGQKVDIKTETFRREAELAIRRAAGGVFVDVERRARIGHPLLHRDGREAFVSGQLLHR